ncbi:MAG TPA: NAD/NADP octopine/nopaline dehydrogenase family protein [Candidatus Cybelea sp.]|nr:NAD/NADP octopine/nopaline dehydrogenase family protein [Candidatus Cybelea sp.]
MKTVCVIGAGMGGVYLLPQLNRAGCKVRLHDIDKSRIAPFKARGGVEVEGENEMFAALELATTDLRAAVSGAELIIIVTGGNTHAAVARGLAPLLADGQTVLMIQGNTGGAFIFRHAVAQNGCTAKIDVAEMDNYPFAFRRVGPVRLRPVTEKRWLQVAALPAKRGEDVARRLKPIFPNAAAAPNVLHTSLTNMNSILHVASCVANAGAIERKTPFRFYGEGCTPAVARLYTAVDSERVAIAAALGAKVPTLAEWWARVYGVREATLVETAKRLTYDETGPYQPTGTPDSLAHKYILEDLPTGLVPTGELGKAAGVPTPAIDAVVSMVRIMTGRDFAAEARTLDRMGLGGMDGAAIRRVAESGFEG